MTGPILTHFDKTCQTKSKLETDTSDFTVVAILSQFSDDDWYHPVAFYSRKFSDVEINYDVHNQKMLAIVAAI